MKKGHCDHAQLAIQSPYNSVDYACLGLNPREVAFFNFQPLPGSFAYSNSLSPICQPDMTKILMGRSSNVSQSSIHTLAPD